MRLKIYYGGPQPLVAVGRHQCHLLRFAFENQGWHSFRQDRVTKRAIDGLLRRGYITVVGDQFKFTSPASDPCPT